MKAVAVILAAMCMTFVGCGGGPQEYRSVDALASALRAEDLGCGTLEPAPPSDLVLDRATCGELDLYVFEDERVRDRWLEVGSGLGDVVVGPNWVIVAGDDEDDIADALDAELR